MKQDVFDSEKTLLCKNATFSENSKGRLYPINSEDLRTDFQRDRDRIIHSKAFRRLMHKMQVFLAPEGDHYRTRLTHTLEVSQIARTISRAMRLNEDLTEAIALGHDLGHTPFGHSGEKVLDTISSIGFKHAEQSLRVSDVIEKLNLTYEVRDGILKHTNMVAETKEGQIVRIADRIAYINHDIDDAIRAGILTNEDLPKEDIEILGSSHGTRISTMVHTVINHGSDDLISMEEPYKSATEHLHKFMYERVYYNSLAKKEDNKVTGMISYLFEFFMKHPEKLPKEFEQIMETEGVERAVLDNIAGMTDRYAITVFEELFVPKAWQLRDPLN